MAIKRDEALIAQRNVENIMVSQPVTKGHIRFHLYEISQAGKSTETEKSISFFLRARWWCRDWAMTGES